MLQIVLMLILLLDAPAPPEQPPSGPGGSDYTHASVSVSAFGSGVQRYGLSEPREPTPYSAPVVLYLQGYGAIGPDAYHDLMVHLGRKGFTVIYPRYGWPWNSAAYEQNAVDALVDALDRLAGPDHVDPDPDHFAVAGHSLGGILSLRIANRAKTDDLPIPDAIVLHDAAGYGTAAYPHIPLEDLSDIDPDTLLAFIIAQTSIGEPGATGIVARGWNNTRQIPRDRKNALLIRSDGYGKPALISDHFSIVNGELDAIDWYGYWKPTEAALNCAFFGIQTEYILGSAPEVHDMGLWSDAVRVRPVIVAEDVGY